jgi:glycogen(starch) synthase
MENPWNDVAQSGEWLLSLERRLRPDVVHLNGFAHGDLAWESPAVVVGHSCVLSWWSAVRGGPAPAQWDEYRKRVRNGLRQADAVVAVSRFIAGEFQKCYGPLGPIAVIYNGRDPAVYLPERKEEFVLSCGRLWDEAKNIRALDQAASRLRWDVYVAGEDKHPEGGRAGLKQVHALGCLSASELQRWYARAAIYALPARYEPFGLSVLEAALSGCALVLGDIPSLREIWHDAALFVPADDHEALAAAIDTLISSRSLRDGLARSARARALTFTPERMMQAYLDVYSQARMRTGLSCAS